MAVPAVKRSTMGLNFMVLKLEDEMFGDKLKRLLRSIYSPGFGVGTVQNIFTMR